MARFGWLLGVLALLATAALADAEVIMINGRAMMPARYVSESFGASINYNTATKDVTLSFGASSARMVVDQPVAYIGGRRTDLDTPVIIISGVTYVPVRVVAAVIGAEVNWDRASGRVLVMQPSSRKQVVMRVSRKPLPYGLAKKGKVPPGHAKHGTTPAMVVTAPAPTGTTTVIINNVHVDRQPQQEKGHGKGHGKRRD